MDILVANYKHFNHYQNNGFDIWYKYLVKKNKNRGGNNEARE